MQLCQKKIVDKLYEKLHSVMAPKSHYSHQFVAPIMLVDYEQSRETKLKHSLCHKCTIRKCRKEYRT